MTEDLEEDEEVEVSCIEGLEDAREEHGVVKARTMSVKISCGG